MVNSLFLIILFCGVDGSGDTIQILLSDNTARRPRDLLTTFISFQLN
jgi:hypothetical protein